MRRLAFRLPRKLNFCPPRRTTPPAHRRPQPRPSTSLRASTPDLDFEEAVRRQQQRSIPPSSSLRQANRPQEPDWGTDAPNLRSASQRRTRGERDQEIFDDQDL